MLVSAGVELIFFLAVSMGYISDLNLRLRVYKINSIPVKICTHLNGISWTNLIFEFQKMKTKKMQLTNSRSTPRANGC